MMRTVTLGTNIPIDVDRYNELYKMVRFLGSRKDYSVREESFLEGMCEHHTLFHGKTLKPVAKIVNEFNKSFTLVEYEGGVYV
jgi:hypothetical protein